MIHTCSVKPYHDSEFGHFIGYTDEDCRNIVICRKYNPNGCVVRDRFGNCISTGFYVDCYRKDGSNVRYRYNNRCLVGNGWCPC
ncbi:hypothetical protein PIROE2DRAFT_18613 [Piromyces sp. E2]|nr:hypothetical protein PIROE2DRAFT_18613 [Piromyces sp. E2]|eukprot:OUM56667.1 hypothetical protein PIROE2DRAFT_18613 [Piromyces sp. E2]